MADALIPTPPSDFDTAWKLTLETYLVEFCELLFPHVHAGVDWSRGHEFLDKELQQVTAESASGRGTVDKLVKVWANDGTEEWILIHVEVQSQHEGDFAGRMYRYHYRLFDRYGRDVVSLAVLGDDRPAWRPAEYLRECLGCGVRFTYPIAKLLDYKGRDAWLTANQNPLAAIVQGHLEAIRTQGDATERTGRKVRLVRSLYDRGLTNDDIRRIYRLLNWIVTLPKDLELRFHREMDMFESEKQTPLMTPLEKIFFEDGIEKGIEKGKLEFRREAIQLMLNARFGWEGAALMPNVGRIGDSALLEKILIAVGTAKSLDEVRSQIP